MANIIQIRRDTAANWASANPVLAQGELGVELDTNKFKIGNGSSAWSSLSYLIDVGNYLTASSTNTLTNKTISVDSNTVSGVAASSFVISNSSGNIDGSASQKAIPSGDVVGTSDSQTLTNKTISYSSNTLTGVAPTASPTFSGTVTTATADLLGSVRGNVTAVAASAIDCSAGNYFTKTATGALTWTVTNVPSSRAYSFILELTNGGTGTQTWFSGIKWPGGTAPTLTASGVDVLGFITDDGGTTWRGVQLMKDSK